MKRSTASPPSLKKTSKLKRKVKSAMTYPGAGHDRRHPDRIGLVTFIVPKFIALFKDFDITMPPPTQFLIDCSNFMTNPVNDVILIGTVVVLVVAINRLKADENRQTLL